MKIAGINAKTVKQRTPYYIGPERTGVLLIIYKSLVRCLPRQMTGTAGG
jgi:hypothetical protein